jgi:hypothetical protein
VKGAYLIDPREKLDEGPLLVLAVTARILIDLGAGFVRSLRHIGAQSSTDVAKPIGLSAHLVNLELLSAASVARRDPQVSIGSAAIGHLDTLPARDTHEDVVQARIQCLHAGQIAAVPASLAHRREREDSKHDTGD